MLIFCQKSFQFCTPQLKTQQSILPWYTVSFHTSVHWRKALLMANLDKAVKKGFFGNFNLLINMWVVFIINYLFNLILLLWSSFLITLKLIHDGGCTFKKIYTKEASSSKIFFLSMSARKKIDLNMKINFLRADMTKKEVLTNWKLLVLVNRK